MDLNDIFEIERPLIGMVHLGPLPGSPLFEGEFEKTLDRAAADARTLAEGGMNGFIIENFFDVPYYPGRVPPATVAAMTEAGRRLAPIGLPFGINVLRNDPVSGIAIAYATGAAFIRVNVFVGARLTDQGLLEATAYQAQRERRRFYPNLAIFADIGVKHSSPLGAATLANEAADAASRGFADALIVSGSETGEAASLDEIRMVKDHVPQIPVLIGSGVTAENARDLLRAADGAIIGTGVKRQGRVEESVDIERVRGIVSSI
jgi:hypothetical protein